MMDGSNGPTDHSFIDHSFIDHPFIDRRRSLDYLFVAVNFPSPPAVPAIVSPWTRPV
jgi:hypothetical protein